MTTAPILHLASLLRQSSRAVALTGAGVSTESGIPDYRSPESLVRARRPIQGPEFVRSVALRRRYWARAMAGWERFSTALPGPSHVALARLENAGILQGLITQNVDRLHHAAGSRAVTELHGALAEVICLDCHGLEERESVQHRMRNENESWLREHELHKCNESNAEDSMAPDGDAELGAAKLDDFIPPTCIQCGGALKPNVVFFGHNVARPIVDEAYARIDAADLLLVAGTSLAVFSGYRFLLRASERQIPIAIVNRGPTRGEERAALKIEASTGEVLSAMATAIV